MEVSLKKICQKCRKKFDYKFDFCPYCGNLLEGKDILESIENKNITTPLKILTTFLLIALLPHNIHAYYTFLKLLCFLVFLYLAASSVNLKEYNWGWTFSILSILYNPIIKIHFKKDFWFLINIITLIIIIIAIRKYQGRKIDRLFILGLILFIVTIFSIIPSF